MKTRFKMRLEDAMVYVLATAGFRMTTQRIADEINNKRLHVRRDGNPVTDKQVYAAVRRFPDTFVREGGRILLSM